MGKGTYLDIHPVLGFPLILDVSVFLPGGRPAIIDKDGLVLDVNVGDYPVILMMV